MSLRKFEGMKSEIVSTLNNLYARAIEEWDMHPLDIPELVLLNEIRPIYVKHGIAKPTLQMLKDGVTLYYIECVVDALELEVTFND